MAGERLFHFQRRNVDAAHLHHVVASANAGIPAFIVADVLIASARPFAGEGRRRLFRIAPIQAGAGWPLHLQFAVLADGRRRSIVGDDPRFVARHDLSGAAVAHLTRLLRNEDVQHFGRAEAIEHVYAEPVMHGLAKMSRQRLPRRGRQPQRWHVLPLRAAITREPIGEECRHAAEDRYTVPAQ